MKKHKVKIIEPLFKKEKDYAKVLADPKKFNELKDLINTIVNTNNNITMPKTLNSWYSYVISILPKFNKDIDFIEKLGELVNEYSNEQ